MAGSAEYEEWGGGEGDAASAENWSPNEEPEEMDYEEYEGGRASLFATGIAIGLAVGTGIALLMAPQSGELTRRKLRSRAQDVSDRWEDLRDELDWLARRSKRRVTRGIKRGRWNATRSWWRAEDVVARGRRKVGY